MQRPLELEAVSRRSQELGSVEDRDIVGTDGEEGCQSLYLCVSTRIRTMYLPICSPPQLCAFCRSNGLLLPVYFISWLLRNKNVSDIETNRVV